MASDDIDLATVAHAAATLQEALNIIGDTERADGDKDMAKLICESELAMRELVRYELRHVADEV